MSTFDTSRVSMLKEAVDITLRQRLKKHLMSQAERIVDETVEELASEIQTNVSMYRNTMGWQDAVDIIVTDKRSKED